MCKATIFFCLAKKIVKIVDKIDVLAYNVNALSELAYANRTVQKIIFRRISMNLRAAEEGKEYIVKSIETDDEELDAFLFSLGCYAGEPITVVSRRKGTCVVSIKDGRYSIDDELAEAIIV